MRARRRFRAGSSERRAQNAPPNTPLFRPPRPTPLATETGERAGVRFTSSSWPRCWRCGAVSPAEHGRDFLAAAQDGEAPQPHWLTDGAPQVLHDGNPRVVDAHHDVA